MVVFGAMAAVAAFFELTKSKGGSTENAPKDFWRFRTNYTLVYALMMGATSWNRSLLLLPTHYMLWKILYTHSGRV